MSHGIWTFAGAVKVVLCYGLGQRGDAPLYSRFAARTPPVIRCRGTATVKCCARIDATACCSCSRPFEQGR